MFFGTKFVKEMKTEVETKFAEGLFTQQNPRTPPKKIRKIREK